MGAKNVTRKVSTVIRPTSRPLPRLWAYKQDDKTTWQYLDVIVKDGYIRWVPNPEFKYGHLVRVY